MKSSETGEFNIALKKHFKTTRKQSDEKLISNGAGVIATGEQILLNPTLEQQEQIQREYLERKKRLEQKIEEEREITKLKYSRNSERSIITSENISENIKQELKDKLLYQLKRKGFVIEIEGINIYDINNFRDPNKFKQIMGIAGYFLQTKNGKKLKHFSRELAMFLLEGEKVISIEDYKKQKLEDISVNMLQEKYFVNTPNTLEEITNIEIIRNKEYYLDYWDVFKGNMVNSKKYFNTIDGNKISLIELSIAVKIFRDLKGYRNKKGQLMIFDKEKQKFILVTINILRRFGIDRFFRLTQGISKLLVEYCPHLLKSGLLRLDDFEEVTNRLQSENKITRTERVLKLKKNNYFKPEFNGVIYYIGRKFFNFEGEKIPIENIKVVELDDKYLGVVVVHNGVEELKYAILKLTPEEKQERLMDLKNRGKGIYSGVSIGKKEIEQRMKKYSLQEFVIRKEDETKEEYLQKIENLPTYNKVNKIIQDLSNKIGVGLYNLSWREQLQIAIMQFQFGVFNQEERAVSFAKKYGLVGLKTFLSMEQGGIEMGEKILSIGENLRLEVANLIFVQYVKLVNVTSDIRVELKKYLNKEKNKVNEDEVKKIAEKILLKANQLLINFADKIKFIKLDNKINSENQVNTKQIIEDLKDYNEELLFNFSILKELKGVNLEDLKDVTFDKVSVNRYESIKKEIEAISRGEYKLTEKEDDKVKEVYQMFELYRKNYAKREKFQQILLDDFTKILIENPRDTHLYLIKQKGKVVAFNRYDRIGQDKKYLGSCNVMPSVQAMSIGGILFKKSIEQESIGYEIELATDVFTPISILYIEKGQFQVVGISDQFDPNKEMSFIMRRFKDGERKSYYEDKNLIEECKNQVINNNQQEGQDHFIIQMDNLTQQNKEFIKELVNEKKYKITRYFYNQRKGQIYFAFEK